MISATIEAAGSTLVGALVGGVISYFASYYAAKWQFGKTMEFEREQDRIRREEQARVEKEQSDLLFKDLVSEIKNNNEFLKTIKQILDDNPLLSYEHWVSLLENSENLSFIHYESFIGSGLQKYQPHDWMQRIYYVYRRAKTLANKIKYSSELFKDLNDPNAFANLKLVLRKDALELAEQVIREREEVLKMIELAEPLEINPNIKNEGV